MDETNNNSVNISNEVENNNNTNNEPEVKEENKETSDTSKDEKLFTQEEVNKMVQKRLAKEKSRIEKSYKEKMTEAERYSKMSTEEIQKEEIEKKLARLEELEKKEARNEMLKVVTTSLSDNNIPSQFAEFLIGEDADDTKDKVDTFSKIWNKALEKAVNAKLVGKKPTSNNNSKSTGSKLTLEEIEKMSVDEVMKNMKEVQEFYKNNKK